MEIIFQYAITDLRRFIRKYSYLHDLDIFKHGDDEGFKFLKSAGECFGVDSVTKDIFQAVDFDSRRSVKIRKWLSFCKKKEKEGVYIKLLPRRFYIDKNNFVSGMYEICFEIYSRNEIDFKFLELLIKELLNLEIRISKVYKMDMKNSARDMESDKAWIPKTLDKDMKNSVKEMESDFTGKEYLRTFGNANKALIRHYCLATSQKRYCDDLQDSLKYVKCDAPHIFIRTYRRDKIDLSCLSKDSGEILIHNFLLFEYNVSLLHNLSNKNTRRVFQLINEIPVLKKSLYFVLNNIDNGKLCPGERTNESDNLQSFLLKVIQKITNKEFLSNMPSEYEEYINSVLQQSGIDSVTEKLKVGIKVRPHVFRVVCEYLKEEALKMSNNTRETKSPVSIIIHGNSNAPITVGDENVVINEFANESIEVIKKINAIDGLLQTQKDFLIEIINDAKIALEQNNENNKKSCKDKFKSFVAGVGEAVGKIYPVLKSFGTIAKFFSIP